MNAALVTYFSYIAATFNFDAGIHSSKPPKERTAKTPYHVKIQVNVDEVDPYTGRTLLIKKYTRKLPVSKSKEEKVEVDLKSFLGKFSCAPVKVCDTYVEPPTISSKMKGKIDSNIKTVCAKNKDLHAEMTVDLVDEKDAQKSYGKYKKNIGVRVGYFVAAIATSTLLIPVGIAITPILMCCDLCSKNPSYYSHETTCCYSGGPCSITWECIMYPQNHLWSRVFSKKSSRSVAVVTC